MKLKKNLKELVSKLKQNSIAVIGIPIILITSILGIILFLANENIYEPPPLNLTSQPKQEFNSSYINAEVEGVEQTLRLQVSDSQEEITQGLMYVQEMNENQGMLFVFQNEQYLTFWMKNTYIPLDIAFLDKNKEIINIESNTEPLNTEKRYRSKAPAKYAIEVNAGWFERNEIDQGKMFNFYEEK